MTLRKSLSMGYLERLSKWNEPKLQAMYTKLAAAREKGDICQLEAAMQERYLELWAFISEGSAKNLSDTEVTELLKEIVGLGGRLSWEHDLVSQSADLSRLQAGDMMRDSGYSLPERVSIMSGRSTARRPRDCVKAILALQFHLEGKTDLQIADELCKDRNTHNPHRSDTEIGEENRCAGMFRHKRSELQSFLERWGWELTRSVTGKKSPA